MPLMADGSEMCGGSSWNGGHSYRRKRFKREDDFGLMRRKSKREKLVVADEVLPLVVPFTRYGADTSVRQRQVTLSIWLVEVLLCPLTGFIRCC